MVEPETPAAAVRHSIDCLLGRYRLTRSDFTATVAKEFQDRFGSAVDPRAAVNEALYGSGWPFLASCPLAFIEEGPVSPGRERVRVAETITEHDICTVTLERLKSGRWLIVDSRPHG